MFTLVVCLSGAFALLELGKLSKYMSWFLGLIPLSLLFVMVSFNRLNRDYFAYKNAFVIFGFRDTFDFGYAFLVDTVEKLGGDHEHIVFMAGVLLVIVLLKWLKTSSYINLVVLFYCAYPLIYDINQIRNFFMYLIMILSFGYVIDQKPIKHYLVWVVSFSMHKFALVYLPFYYFCREKMSRQRFFWWIIRITIILAILSPFVIRLASRFYPAKMAAYLVPQPRVQIIAVFIYAIIDFVTVWWIDKRIANKVSPEDSRKMEILYRFVWLSILILPIAFYFVEVSRMQRNAILVKYIYCALAMRYLTFNERVVAVVLLASSIVFYLFMINYNHNWDLYRYLDENTLRYYFKRYLF